LCRTSDGYRAISIHTFNSFPAAPRFSARRRRQDISSSPASRRRQKATAIASKEVARLHGIEKPYYATPGRRASSIHIFTSKRW